MTDTSYFHLIPTQTLTALQLYEQQKIPTGGFLYAVLTNDLFGAMGSGDTENVTALKHIVMYIYNNMPNNCFGSRQKVHQWLNPSKEASNE